MTAFSVTKKTGVVITLQDLLEMLHTVYPDKFTGKEDIAGNVSVPGNDIDGSGTTKLTLVEGSTINLLIETK